MTNAILQKQLDRLLEKRSALIKRGEESNDPTELKVITKSLTELNEDITELRAAITGSSEISEAPTFKNSDILKGFMTKSSAPTEEKKSDDIFTTMEYRMAFKSYVQKGTAIPADLLSRAGGDLGTTNIEDIGLTFPTTVMNEFIKKMPEKVYGRIFAKVRKLNIKGGVKIPISNLKANFKWITETTVSPKQKAGDIKEYVEFSYNIGEIRVSQTLLSNIEGLEAFESAIVEIVLEAYVEAMEKSLFTGTGEGQPLGIFNDPRVTNVVEFTAGEFDDWREWRKKLFAKIPLKLRKKGEFVFPVSTIESNLMTMEDGVHRPIFRDAVDLTLNNEGTEGKFFGRPVESVESDIIGDFDSASAGDIVGVYWIPGDYGVNTQYQFGIKRYFDEESNQFITKGLTIVDGKILDVNNCFIIKKKAGV